MRKRYFTALFFITLLIPGIVDSQVLLSKEIKNHSIFSTEEFGSNSQLKNNELVSTKSYRWSKTTSSLYHPLYPQYGSPSLKAGFPPGRKILNIIHVLVESEHYIKGDLMNENPIIDYTTYEAVSNFDYTFNDILSENDIYLLLRWTQNIQTIGVEGIHNRYHFENLYHQAFLGQFRIDLNPSAKFVFKSIYHFRARDWFLQPSIEWLVIDQVQIAVGIDLWGGPAKSFYGSFNDRQKVQLKFKYSY